jgi:hypothetical protein
VVEKSTLGKRDHSPPFDRRRTDNDCEAPGIRSFLVPSAPVPVPQPAGIQVAGTVADGAWRPFIGATVEVLNGPHAGLSTSTDSRGEFRLSGSFNETTEFRAAKDGFVAAVRPLPTRCERCNPNWWIHFVLESVGPKADLAGNYSLTFVADACLGLPDEMRTRTYDATATSFSNPGGPADTNFVFTVSGAPFRTGYNQFTVGVTADYFSAYVGDHGNPGILEQVAPTTSLGFEGVPSASIGSSNVSTIDAAFDGMIDYCEGSSETNTRFSCTPKDGSAHVRCASKNHRLILTRR